LRAVADAVNRQDSAQMLDIVERLERDGESLHHFSRELSRYWRNLLVAKISGRANALIAASEQEQAQLIETANLFSEEDLTRFLHLTLEMYKSLQTSLQPRLHLELGLVKLVQAGRLQSIEQAIAELGNAAAHPAAGPPRKAMTPPGTSEEREPAKPRAEAPGAAVRSGDLRKDLHDGLAKLGLSFSADAILQSEVSFEGNELVIRAPKAMMLALKDGAVQRVAAQIAGKPVKVRVEAGERTAAALPAGTVKRFQELFPGAQVRTVRNLNE
jgi:DNA polymerase-3 subunit gamma/tau